MVEAHQVQDRGVDVVDVGTVLDGVQADLVGGARRSPPFTPPPAIHIVKPVALWSRPRPPFWLTGVRPNSPPQTTRVSSSRPVRFRSVRSAATGLIGQAAHLLVVGVDIVVRVPLHGDRAAARIELDEPHPALDQPAGQQAAGAELDGPRVVQAVHLAGRCGLAREVNRLGRGALHPVGQLVDGDPGGEFGSRPDRGRPRSSTATGRESAAAGRG